MKGVRVESMRPDAPGIIRDYTNARLTGNHVIPDREALTATSLNAPTTSTRSPSPATHIHSEAEVKGGR
jgi:hypothetical protein